MTTKHDNRPFEAAIAEAMVRLITFTGGLSLAAIGRIINQDRAALSRAAKGYRPWGVLLARLFLLTREQDGAFAPKNATEQLALEREQANPPKTLTEYLEKKAQPAIPPPARHSPRKQQPRMEPKLPPEMRSQGPPDIPEAVKKILDVLCQSLGISPDQLRELVVRAVGEPKPSDASPPSPFNEVVAGKLEVAGQEIEGVRFVLTAASFMKFAGAFTDEEIADTVKLIQELRRRLNVTTQIQDTTHRSRIAKALAREIDELYLAIELSREAVPAGAASRIAQLRTQLTAVRGGGTKT